MSLMHLLTYRLEPFIRRMLNNVDPFYPKVIVNGKEELAFSVQIAKEYDSIKANRFLARGKEEEIIDYRGNVELQDNRLGSLQSKDLSTTRYPIMFYAVDWEQLLRDEYIHDIFQGSIVMMGSWATILEIQVGRINSLHHLNKKVAGKANPDMFGLGCSC
ncbi:MAG: hypothetical protein U5K54_22035 [Cytophagales bacterium]|nr:hypothetical protein [Cytophagales bacterium]